MQDRAEAERQQLTASLAAEKEAAEAEWANLEAELLAARHKAATARDHVARERDQTETAIAQVREVAAERRAAAQFELSRLQRDVEETLHAGGVEQRQQALAVQVAARLRDQQLKTGTSCDTGCDTLSTLLGDLNASAMKVMEASALWRSKRQRLEAEIDAYDAHEMHSMGSGPASLPHSKRPPVTPAAESRSHASLSQAMRSPLMPTQVLSANKSSANMSSTMLLSMAERGAAGRDEANLPSRHHRASTSPLTLDVLQGPVSRSPTPSTACVQDSNSNSNSNSPAVHSRANVTPLLRNALANAKRGTARVPGVVTRGSRTPSTQERLKQQEQQLQRHVSWLRTHEIDNGPK